MGKRDFDLGESELEVLKTLWEAGLGDGTWGTARKAAGLGEIAGVPDSSVFTDPATNAAAGFEAQRQASYAVQMTNSNLEIDRFCGARR